MRLRRIERDGNEDGKGRRARPFAKAAALISLASLMACGGMNNTWDTPAPIPDKGHHSGARDAGVQDEPVADIGTDLHADAMPDAEADAKTQPVRQYRSNVTEDVTGWPSITSEVAVDLDKQEFIYSISDMTFYTIYADGSYEKGVDLGGFCMISSLKNADLCGRLLKNENLTLSLFIFPEVVKQCTDGGTELIDILEGAYQKGEKLEFEQDELWASYVRTAAGDFLSDKSVFTYNNPNLVYSFTYGGIAEENDAVSKLRAAVDKAWAGKDCEKVEY